VEIGSLWGKYYCLEWCIAYNNISHIIFQLWIRLILEKGEGLEVYICMEVYSFYAGCFENNEALLFFKHVYFSLHILLMMKFLAHYS